METKVEDLHRWTVNQFEELNAKVLDVEESIKETIKDIPDPLLHQRISYAKSALRVIGFLCLPVNLYVAGTILILAEVLGVVEEMV